MLAPLHACGIRPSEDQLLTLERTVKNQFDDNLERDGKADHGFWGTVLCTSFRRARSARRTVAASGDREHAQFSKLGPDSSGNARGPGRMAVISNADGRIAGLLARHGIADCFRSITDSGIVGQEKPHRVIFETALASVLCAGFFARVCSARARCPHDSRRDAGATIQTGRNPSTPLSTGCPSLYQFGYLGCDVAHGRVRRIPVQDSGDLERRGVLRLRSARASLRS